MKWYDDNPPDEYKREKNRIAALSNEDLGKELNKFESAYKSGMDIEMYDGNAILYATIREELYNRLGDCDSKKYLEKLFNKTFKSSTTPSSPLVSIDDTVIMKSDIDVSECSGIVIGIDGTNITVLFEDGHSETVPLTYILRVVKYKNQ
jgi:hypothetical protein